MFPEQVAGQSNWHDDDTSTCWRRWLEGKGGQMARIHRKRMGWGWVDGRHRGWEEREIDCEEAIRIDVHVHPGSDDDGK